MAKKQIKKLPVKKTAEPALPKIQGFIGGGVQVVADIDGTLYRINADMGTISKLRWEVGAT